MTQSAEQPPRSPISRSLVRTGTPLTLLLAMTVLLGACAPAPARHSPQAGLQTPGIQAQPQAALPESGQPGAPAVTQVVSPTSSSAPVSAPRVSLTADRAMTAPLTVTFTAALPEGGQADWQFADGGRASGASASHIFYRPGRYEVQAHMTVSGHTYLATLPVEVRLGGPEAAAAVVLLDSGTLALSAQGSRIYAPYTPSFTLDGQPSVPLRQAMKSGSHTVKVSVNAASGELSRSYSFRSRAALSPAEVTRQQDYEAEVLSLTNAARTAGWNCKRQADGGTVMPPLRLDPQLLVAARAQTVGMALNGYFDHRSGVDGSMPDARVRASGYRAVSDAENIAAGQQTPVEVVAAWKKSPGHCPNIMGDYDDLGVAYLHQDGSPYGEYWTQVFGRKGE